MTAPSVTVLLFASYADAFGRSAVDVTLPAQATVRDVVAQVRATHPKVPLPPRPLVAVNQEYAEYDHPVTSGDEVALIPPVAGG